MRNSSAERAIQAPWRRLFVVALAFVAVSCGIAEPNSTTRQRVAPVTAEVLGETQTAAQQPVLVENDGCLVGQPLTSVPSAETFVARWNAALAQQNELCDAGSVELEVRAWTLESFGPDWVGRKGSQFGLIENDGKIERFNVSLVVDDMSEELDERVFALASIAVGAADGDARWSDLGCGWSASWSGHRYQSNSGGGSISINFC